MNPLRRHAGLVVILAAFMGLGTLYLHVTPLLETPDEPSHFSVVKYIADTGQLPPPNPASLDAGPAPTIQSGPPVYYAPPLYYVLGALLIADLNTDGFAGAVIPNPNWARGWAPTPGRSPENKNVYIHTAEQRPPYAGWAIAMLRLRVFSLLLGAVTVIGVYALTHALTNLRIYQYTATALVAFNPAFLFVTTGVTNDALLIALSTWAFVLMVRIANCELRIARGERRGARDELRHNTQHVSRFTFHASRLSLLGLVLGLAALTKQSALALLPVAALAVAWGAGSRRQALKGLLLLLAPVAFIAGWWYLHNTLAYSDPLGLAPHRPPTPTWSPPVALLLRQLGQAFQGYWGAFGWGLILADPAVDVLMGTFVLLGLLGWLWSLRDEPQKPPVLRRIEGTTYHRATLVLAFGVLLNVMGLVLWLWRTSAPYGRLLYPTIGPLAVLIVLGWRRWLSARYTPLFAVVVGAMGLYATVVPFRYLHPAYANPVVPLSASFDAKPLDIQFDHRFDLLGYRITPEEALPGTQVQLTLYWQATAPSKDDLTIFVQLAPQDPEQRVAGLDDLLGSSRYPTSVWQPGQVIRQIIQLQLPETVYAPALYWFTVGLYGEARTKRLPVTADGEPVPERAVRLGPLWLLERDTEPLGASVYYRLGAAIRLVGYDIQTSQAHTLTVTLDWRSVAAPEDEWTVFVHLLDPSGNTIAQHDGPPRGGDYPTWAWRMGDRILDTHTLALPPDLPPGPYRLQVGLYQPEGDTRMPVFDADDERLPDDVIPLIEMTLPAGSD